MNYSLRIGLLSVIFASSFLIHPVYAQDDGIGQSRLTPASPLYFIKSIREILELKFAGTVHAKAVRELEFATRRIREVKGLIASRQDLIEPALYQYLSHLEIFLGWADLKDPVFAAKVSREISGQMNALQIVYGQVSDKRALMSIRATVHNVSDWDLKLIDKLQLSGRRISAEEIIASRFSACKFLSQEASSSALNEVEKAVLSDRAKTCFKKDLPASFNTRD